MGEGRACWGCQYKGPRFNPQFVIVRQNSDTKSQGFDASFEGEFHLWLLIWFIQLLKIFTFFTFSFTKLHVPPYFSFFLDIINCIKIFKYPHKLLCNIVLAVSNLSIPNTIYLCLLLLVFINFCWGSSLLLNLF